MRKSPIDAAGRFYENTDPKSCCPVCSTHKIVIIQHLPGFYAMHTWLATPGNSMYCIHAWRTREDDPPCLRFFKPTTSVVKRRVGFNQLSQALVARGDGVLPDQAGRIREEMAAPRIRNPFRVNRPVQAVRARPAARGFQVAPGGAIPVADEIVRDNIDIPPPLEF